MNFVLNHKAKQSGCLMVYNFLEEIRLICSIRQSTLLFLFSQTCNSFWIDLIRNYVDSTIENRLFLKGSIDRLNSSNKKQLPDLTMISFYFLHEYFFILNRARSQLYFVCLWNHGLCMVCRGKHHTHINKRSQCQPNSTHNIY